MTNPIVLTTSEVAVRFGVTNRQVQRLAKKGVLPVYGKGERNTQYFRISDVNKAARARA